MNSPPAEAPPVTGSQGMNMVTCHLDLLGAAQAMVLCHHLHVVAARVGDDLAPEPDARNALENDQRPLLECEVALRRWSRWRAIMCCWPLHGSFKLSEEPE